MSKYLNNPFKMNPACTITLLLRAFISIITIISIGASWPPSALAKTLTVKNCTFDVTESTTVLQLSPELSLLLTPDEDSGAQNTAYAVSEILPNCKLKPISDEWWMGSDYWQVEPDAAGRPRLLTSTHISATELILTLQVFYPTGFKDIASRRIVFDDDNKAYFADDGGVSDVLSDPQFFSNERKPRTTAELKKIFTAEDMDREDSQQKVPKTQYTSAHIFFYPAVKKDKTHSSIIPMLNMDFKFEDNHLTVLKTAVAAIPITQFSIQQCRGNEPNGKFVPPNLFRVNENELCPQATEAFCNLHSLANIGTFNFNSDTQVELEFERSLNLSDLLIVGALPPKADMPTIQCKENHCKITNFQAMKLFDPSFRYQAYYCTAPIASPTGKN